MSDAEVIKEIDEILKESEGAVEELNLDNLEIHKFTKALGTKIEKIKDLVTLTLNECQIESLEGFPSLPNLTRLEAFNNGFKGADIKHLVSKIPKVKALFLGENQIADYGEVDALKSLKELTHLDLSSTDLSEKADYRQKIFALLPHLEVLDDQDKDGNPVYEDEEDEGEEGEGSDQYQEPEEDDDEPEDEDYDEEDEDDDYDNKKGRKKSKK